MKLIRADHDRWLEIPGLPGPTRRPVDIDKSQTGFENLRSLRIYRFDKHAEINGHAEEDEVFLIVLAGSVELTVSGDGWPEGSRTFTLSAPGLDRIPFVAYLPPQSAYRLISITDSDVAYARATPSSGPPSTVFTPSAATGVGQVSVLLDEGTHARRLRLRLVRIDALHEDVTFRPLQDSEATLEALVHVRMESPEQIVTMARGAGEQAQLHSWDTVAIAPGDEPEIRIRRPAAVLVLIVLAV